METSESDVGIVLEPTVSSLPFNNFISRSNNENNFLTGPITKSFTSKNSVQLNNSSNRDSHRNTFSGQENQNAYGENASGETTSCRQKK